MEVSSLRLSWRTGPSIGSNVRFLMTGGSLNTGFSIGTANEDASDIPGQAQAEATPTVSNTTLEAFSAGVGLLERLQPSLVTLQGGERTSWVWLNGEFRTKPWTQMVPGATQSPLDLIEDEVFDPELALSDSEPEGT